MDVWSRLDERIECAPTVADLYAHRVHLYAAWRWREHGRPVPVELAEHERWAALMRLTAPALLRAIRSVYDGPLLVLKGPEVAAWYPRPEVRFFGDLDILVPNAVEVQHSLLAAGFVEAGEPEAAGHHHLTAVRWPALPMQLEVHGDVSWPTWLPPPAPAELFAAADRESALGAGVLTLPPAQQALAVAAHSWREAPLTRLGSLLDVFLIAHDVDPGEIASLARRWGVGRLWDKTAAAADVVLGGTPPRARVPRNALRILRAVRKPTVFEAKRAELTAPFQGLPVARALGVMPRVIAAELRSQVRA